MVAGCIREGEMYAQCGCGVRLMAFDRAKHLVLAEELAVHSTDEVSLRSTTSRAYYVVFCTARNRLLGESEEIPKTGEAHSAVWTK